MGPKAARSTSLTPLEEEAAAVTFRQKTLLPLDDCLHALQREVPSLTRSSLHRLYLRHGISLFPRTGDQKREKKPFTRLIHEIGLKTKIADGILLKIQCVPPRT